MKETFDYYYDLLDEYCDNKIGYWEIQSSKMNNIQKHKNWKNHHCRNVILQQNLMKNILRLGLPEQI